MAAIHGDSPIRSGNNLWLLLRLPVAHALNVCGDQNDSVEAANNSIFTVKSFEARRNEETVESKITQTMLAQYWSLWLGDVEKLLKELQSN